MVKNSRNGCFADDTKIFRRVDSNSDAALLQTNISNLDSRSTSSGLVFNQEKCKCLRITRQIQPDCHPLQDQGQGTHRNIRRVRPCDLGNQQPYLVQTCFRTMCKGKQTAWLLAKVWLGDNQHKDPPHSILVCCSACPWLRQPSVISPVHRAY